MSQFPAPELKPSHGCLGLLLSGVGAFLGAIIGATGAVVGSGGDWATAADSPVVVLVSTFAAQVGLLAGIPVALRRSGASPGEALGLRPARRRDLLFGGLGILGFGLLADLVLAWLRQIFPDLRTVLTDIGELIRAVEPGFRPLVMLGFVVVPALVEELLFRGLLFGALRRRWGPGVAVTVSAAGFALIHFDPLQSVAALLLGLYLGLLRLRSGSLLAPIVAHGVNNAVAVALLAASASPARPPLGLLLLAILLSLVCLRAVGGRR